MKLIPPPRRRILCLQALARGHVVSLLLCLLTSPLTWGQRSDKIAGGTAQTPPVPSPTLTIVPSSYADGVFLQDILVLNRSRPRFHVLLFNPSDKPLRLFEEWNSWGYFGLSFDITYPDGRVVHTAKERHNWDKDFPSTRTVAPNGYYVFEVTFDPAIWTNSLLLEKSGLGGQSCRLQAIYSIESESDALKERAWTGTIRSEERAYIVY